MEPVGCDKGVVASLTGMKGVDGTVGDIVRVVVGMLSGGSRNQQLSDEPAARERQSRAERGEGVLIEAAAYVRWL
jgi:hypothetical protein